MKTTAHLWAIGYDHPGRAEQVREEITRLGWEQHYLLLQDVAVVVRHDDGSFTFNRERFPGIANILACTTVGYHAGLVVAAPLTGATIGALLGGAGTTASALSTGIDSNFIHEVAGLMKPGTSALFVLDDEGDMEMILHAIRGLGGMVLKTNVDTERAKLIQKTLSAEPSEDQAVRRPTDG
jgi:uncharacterized membrane protein